MKEAVIRMENGTGLHGRPAALLASSLKGFAAEVTVLANGKEADASSIVSLMALGAKDGDDITVRASGPDEEAALAAALAAMTKGAEK